MKIKSGYARRVARRKGAGPINYSLPVDSKGQATLNRRAQVQGQDGKVKMRSFSRLRRFDEV